MLLSNVSVAYKRITEARSRPQITIPGLLEYRVNINHKKFPSAHPHHAAIKSWRLTSSMVSVCEVNEEPNPVFVNTPVLLERMMNELETQKEIVLNIRNCNEECFLGITVLVVVSTPETDYIVDTLVLYKLIKEKLGPIFEAPTILKIMYEPQDLRFLQRDFDVYPCGIVSVKEAYAILYTKRDATLKDIIQHYTQKQLTEFQPQPDLRYRPMHADILSHNARTARLTFSCWIVMKREFGDKLLSEPFASSKKICKSVYKLPKRKGAVELWAEYIDGLSSDLRRIFNVDQQRRLYCALINWRRQTSKKLDTSPATLLQRQLLAFVVRAMPSNIESLTKLIPKGSRKFLSHSLLLEVLSIVRSHPMEHPIEVSISTTRKMCADWSEDPVVQMDLAEINGDACEENKSVRSKLKKRRGGVAERVKKLFHYARILKLSKHEIVQYLYKFPNSKVPRF